MINKKKMELVNEMQNQLKTYWVKATLDDIIKIKIRASTGPYVQREAEEFSAIRLPSREIPGFAGTLRCIPLNVGKVTFRNIPLDWITHINGKPLNRVTEWKVKGSKGNTYTIKLIGDQYKCNCPGYTYRKECKHSKMIEASQGTGT